MHSNLEGLSPNSGGGEAFLTNDFDCSATKTKKSLWRRQTIPFEKKKQIK